MGMLSGQMFIKEIKMRLKKGRTRSTAAAGCNANTSGKLKRLLLSYKNERERKNVVKTF